MDGKIEQARLYNQNLGKFIQPDTIIPDPLNPQAWNRYSYVNNSPLNYIDPTGHIACEDLGTEACDENGDYTNEDVSGPSGGGPPVGIPGSSNRNGGDNNAEDRGRRGRGRPRRKETPNSSSDRWDFMCGVSDSDFIPLCYDTLSFEGRGIIALGVGLDVDLGFNINMEAFRNEVNSFDFSNPSFDFSSIDWSATVTIGLQGGISQGGAVMGMLTGHNGNVSDLNGWDIIGRDGVHGDLAICIETCGGATGGWDNNGNIDQIGYGAGVGTSVLPPIPIAFDLSVDFVSWTGALFSSSRFK